MLKSPIFRMFAVLVALAILGPLAAHLFSPTVAGQYDNALPGLLAALFYKGPAYALVIMVVVVLVARYLLNIRSIEEFWAELDGLNNDSYANIIGFTALIVTFVLTVVWPG